MMDESPRHNSPNGVTSRGIRRALDVLEERLEEAIREARSGAVWGKITGTLANQTDLKAALDGKAASGHTHGTGDIVSGTFPLARGGTGATSADAARDNLGTAGLLRPGTAHRLTTGANLDALKTAGDYWCNSGAEAQSMTGIPPEISSNFRMIVFEGGGAAYTQVITGGTTNPVILFRCATSGNYGAWHRVVRADDEELKLTHENLLDNPWFTVNQRGVASWSSGYGVDRWKSDGLVTVGSGYLRISAGNYIYQDMEKPDIIAGKMISGSVMLSDGTIYSGTITREAGTNQDFFYTGNVRLQANSLNRIVLTAYEDKDITAVKLEYGKVPTLKSDSPPNYATELLKCQRYYQVLTPNDMCVPGVALSATQWRVYLPMAVKMASTPTVRVGGIGWAIGGGVRVSSGAVTGFVQASCYVRNLTIDYTMRVTHTGTAIPTNQAMYVALSGGVELNAEL